MNKPRHGAIFRELQVAEGEVPLPSEFMIFTAGVNDSFNGPCLFDAEAAASVMAEYKKHGVRLIVDLQHDSLDKGSDRPDSKDARAWFDLDLRPDGSLWAVNVEWTADGAERLRSKKQRYISPATLEDDSVDPPRVMCLLNAGLVSMPAMYGAPPLVRARDTSVRARLHDLKIDATIRSMMTPELTKAALAAISEKDGDAALALLENIITAAASGEASGEAPEGEPAEASAETSAVEEAPAAEEPKEEPEPAAKSVDADAPERLKLVARLVAVGAETPVTAWSERGKTPVARLVAEPIAELRTRVAALEAAKPAAIKPPAAPSGKPKLSEREIAECKKRGIDPAVYAERKARAVKRAPGAQ